MPAVRPYIHISQKPIEDLYIRLALTTTCGLAPVYCVLGVINLFFCAVF